MSDTRHLELDIEPRQGTPFKINPFEFALVRHQTFIKFQVEKQVSLEANNAYLEAYNLSEEHSSALDFKFDANFLNFGPFIKIKGGYLSTGVRQMFQGVVVHALTTFEAPDYVTRIECRNVYYENMRKQVSYQVSAGTNKADAILSIIQQTGGQIETGQETAIRKRLSGAKYEENELIEGTLDEVLTMFSVGLPRRIIVYWDDAGVSFDPTGRPSEGRETREVSEQTGMIGTPKATVEGIEYETKLDPTYKVNDPVKVVSDATTRLSLAADRTVRTAGTDTSGVVFSGVTSTSKIIHSGDNRDGDFKTSVTTKFIDLLQRPVG